MTGLAPAAGQDLMLGASAPLVPAAGCAAGSDAPRVPVSGPPGCPPERADLSAHLAPGTRRAP
ncbi:MAG: hypothetical protein ACLQI7_29055 [Streptosporangiaceae bacterium]